jgi:hypothetical protein
MEGFLEKKNIGDGVFGRRNWKKRFFILQGSTLTYYESTIPDNLTPESGSFEVAGSIIVTEPPHRERKYVFSIQHNGVQPLLVCADDEATMKLWMSALKLASFTSPPNFNYAKYYEMLGLKFEDNPSLTDVNKRFDDIIASFKDGDMEQLKKKQQAFEIIESYLEELNKQDLFDEFTYDAFIRKGIRGIGFGMLIRDNPYRGYISVKQVLPTMLLQSLNEKAGGFIQTGDRLVRVNGDDVSQFKLLRLQQRLSDSRIPIHTVVKFTFVRRVAKVLSSSTGNPQFYIC